MSALPHLRRGPVHQPGVLRLCVGAALRVSGPRRNVVVAFVRTSADDDRSRRQGAR
jgi:hypothetical protein